MKALYYVILDTNTLHARLHTDEHGLVEEFDTYKEARAVASNLLQLQECRDYDVVAVCTDEENQLV